VEAMKRIPYVECAKDGDNSQLDLCKKTGVQVVPTWSIAGELYPGDQDFEELEKIVATASSTTTVASSTETTKTPPPENLLPALPAVSTETPPPAPPTIASTSTVKTLALAQQLESLNAKMYGAYFCPHCKDQREDFGKEAFAKIEYVECTQDGQESQLALCQQKGIQSVPTWEINGKLFVGQRTIEQLQTLVNAEVASLERTGAASASNNNIAPPPIQSTSSDQALRVANGLESLDAKLYGAHWCRFTQSQKEKIGKQAFAKINYVECSRDGLHSATEDCIEKGIDGFPSWVINGKLYPGDQELEELEAIIQENRGSITSN
jgi:protein-disulfide isomerase